MNWFLDMCIILYYSSEDELLSKKTLKFIKDNQEKSQKDQEDNQENKKNNQENNFLVCYYIAEIDLPKYLRRQKILIHEVVKKMTDNLYVIGSSDEGFLLYPKDKIKAEKLFLKSSFLKNKTELIEFMNKLNQIQIKQENKINFFIEKKAKKVIPVSEIDSELKGSLFLYIGNMSDAKILTSGIQQYNKDNKEGLVLLTADKKDWTNENLNVAIDNKLSKKYPKIPKIEYIQDM